MPSLGNLNHKKYFTEIKSVCDFSALDDSFFLIQAFNKYLLSTYNVTGLILNSRYIVSYICSWIPHANTNQTSAFLLFIYKNKCFLTFYAFGSELGYQLSLCRPNNGWVSEIEKEAQENIRQLQSLKMF